MKPTRNTTVTEYMKSVEVEAAKISLVPSRGNMNKAMYKVGYTDTKAVRNTFKRFTVLPPVHHRNKYNREMTAA